MGITASLFCKKKDSLALPDCGGVKCAGMIAASNLV
jgi:hypothetical protein